MSMPKGKHIFGTVKVGERGQMQIQRSPVQIAPSQNNVSILARSLALHDPCGVRRTHKPV